MIDPADRLFDLLPVVHRQRDAAAGWVGSPGCPASNTGR